MKHKPSPAWEDTVGHPPEPDDPEDEFTLDHLKRRKKRQRPQPIIPDPTFQQHMKALYQ